MSVLIVTSVGEFVVDLHADLCPRTTVNFLKLCRAKYYNGCLFHNVQKDFLAQTGDPTGTGNGGGSAYNLLYGGDHQSRFFDDEIRPELTHAKKGTVAMASAGNASQFYVTLRPDIEYLDDGQHTVFGTVTEGFDTLEKINESYVDGDGRPFRNIRIKHTYVLYVPDELKELVPDELLVPGNSPTGKPNDEVANQARLEDTSVPLEERLDPVQLKEMIRSREARSNAAILECIGDIPDAQVKPPDNVLFVCDLNPVTQDEDLYTIFSRFGTVTSAEVIRDYKTGDSLCYAFVQFDATKACERAFKEMNNCLVDDRRIRVDFSQSVSKMWGPFRQGMQNANKDGCIRFDATGYRAQDRHQGGEKRRKDRRDYVLRDKNHDLVFDDGDGTTADKQDRRDTGRRKIQKLDDWRSESRHTSDRGRKGRHDDHNGYNRPGYQRYSRHDSRNYSKRQLRSRDGELISMTGIKKDDDCGNGGRHKKDDSCPKRSSRY